MMNKQSLVVGLLLERLADSKVGILVKGINGIQPDEIAAELSSQRKTHIYMAAVGYGISTDVEKSEYTLTPSIEKAVLWRSVPEYAGNIVVFVKTDTDKLHSLAEFDVISLRDVSKYLLELQISNESNAPTQNFWRALQQTSDYYSFEAIIEASNPVPTPLLGHRCRSSQEITGSPTPFSTSNHYLWICPRASFSLSNPNIAA